MERKGGEVMRKRGFVGMLLALVMMVFTVSGCGNSLADSFDEKTVKQQAKDDVTIGEGGDFEAWKARFAPDLQASLTEDIYNNYLNLLEEKGNFKEFGKCAVTGQSKDGEDYAIVVLIAEHEKGKVQYTLVYNASMELINYTI